MHRLTSAVTAVTVAVAGFLALSTGAYAHEHRTVGPYEIEVGWTGEPAYAGVLNAVFLQVVDTRGEKPVEGVASTLTVEVSAGGLAPITLAFQPIEHDPGTYAASFIPTSTGGYTFRLKGKIGAQDVDEKFESGPSTFDDVRDISAAQYPAKVPAAEALVARLDALQTAADQARLIGAIGALLGLGGLIAAAVTLTRRT